MKQTNMDVRIKLPIFWSHFFQDARPFSGKLVSAKSFLSQLDIEAPLHSITQQQDIRHLYPLNSHFHFHSSGTVDACSQHNQDNVKSFDTHSSNRFHNLTPQIVDQYRDSFVDQLRCTHFIGMAGKESTLLMPSQQRRLKSENVQRIAGEIRNIQTGFGGYRFNAPQPHNLRPLMALFENKVHALLAEADESSIHYLASYAQYYFIMLHPFYERCGRTSEELMYLLFEQTGFGWRYISSKGNRSSKRAFKRTDLINQAAEGFNRRIASYFGLDSHTIKKTPDIYRAMTATYFPERYDEIYAKETPKPFYYKHPIPEVIEAYYFMMEALLLDEIAEFSLDNPYPHIKQLGLHLRDKGKRKYKGDIPKSQPAENLQSLLYKISDVPVEVQPLRTTAA